MKTHSGRKLSRPTGARLAMLRSMAASLLKHEQVRTTYPKAREVARFTESLLALAKRRNLSAVRRVRSQVPDRAVNKKIFDVLIPRYETRAGGCTRVFRLGRRMGDGAEMAVVKLVS
ncbi:MAG: 50S ribosomal protein L17 [Elusimicrobiota bacterium]